MDALGGGLPPWTEAEVSTIQFCYQVVIVLCHIEPALGGTNAENVTIEQGTILRPVNTSPIFYNDLSPEQAEHYTSLLLP